MEPDGVHIVVVGIGADGWSGLSESARAAILGADEIFGSPRQIATLPAGGPPVTRWPSPLTPALDALCARPDGTACIVASGDPMLHGIGASVAARLPIERLTVIPHISAFALACARLGWPAAEVELVSAVARPIEVFARALQPGRRIVGYISGSRGAASVAALMCARGLGESRFVVLEALGAPEERITDTTAAGWGGRPAESLHAVAIELGEPAGVRAVSLYSRVPGLPDEAFEHDGALTKRYIRAATLAALGPLPGALLWDIGSGSGSIAIEWLRAEPTARAIAVDRRLDRAERAARNGLALGVPAGRVDELSSSGTGLRLMSDSPVATANAPARVSALPLRIVVGEAPAVLAELDAPDAVFIGGGLTAPGMLDACLEALRPGGRIVANAVTLESEQLLVAAHAEHGGELVRLEVAHAEPIGSFTGWRPQMPVVQWSYQAVGEGS